MFEFLHDVLAFPFQAIHEIVNFLFGWIFDGETPPLKSTKGADDTVRALVLFGL